MPSIIAEASSYLLVSFFLAAAAAASLQTIKKLSIEKCQSKNMRIVLGFFPGLASFHSPPPPYFLSVFYLLLIVMTLGSLNLPSLHGTKFGDIFTCLTMFS